MGTLHRTPDGEMHVTNDEFGDGKEMRITREFFQHTDGSMLVSVLREIVGEDAAKDVALAALRLLLENPTATDIMLRPTFASDWAYTSVAGWTLIAVIPHPSGRRSGKS